jgi:hypothetical protein
MPDITSANSILTLTIPPLFGTPEQLQGFATDDIFNVPAIESVELLMGVDGVLSGGFVFKAIEMEIMLQADSSSNSLFDVWWTSMVSNTITYQANGEISLPNIQSVFTFTGGYLTSYMPAPQAKKVLQPRRHRITWNMIAPSPTNI